MEKLKKLLGICGHKWIEQDCIPVYNVYYGRDLPHYHKFILKCEKCGNIKVIKT